MKYADGNENIQPSMEKFIPNSKNVHENEKVFSSWVMRMEEDGLNTVMSNLKFKHNKSGLHNSSQIKENEDRGKLLLIKRFRSLLQKKNEKL